VEEDLKINELQISEIKMKVSDFLLVFDAATYKFRVSV
jgi:hypothetical protein